MKPLRNILAGLLVGGMAFSAMPAMTGCYGTEGAFVVEDTPPPPYEEIVVSQPGFIWVHGRWTHPGNGWVWNPGYYERERPGQVYVDGRWERRGRGHVWIEGGWHPRGRVVARDHR